MISKRKYVSVPLPFGCRASPARKLRILLPDLWYASKFHSAELELEQGESRVGELTLALSLPLSLSLTPYLSLTLSLALTPSLSLHISHSFTHSLSLSLSHSLSLTPYLSLTLALSLSLSLTISHFLFHSLIFYKNSLLLSLFPSFLLISLSLPHSLSLSFLLSLPLSFTLVSFFFPLSLSLSSPLLFPSLFFCLSLVSLSLSPFPCFLPPSLSLL